MPTDNKINYTKVILPKIIALLVVVLVSVVASKFYVEKALSNLSGQKIVVFDMNAEIMKIKRQETSTSEKSESINKLIFNIQKTADEYARNGFLVLDTKNVLGLPKEMVIEVKNYEDLTDGKK